MSAFDFQVLRTDASHPDFRALVAQLSAYLAPINGADHAFYDQHSQTDSIPYALLFYRKGEPVACGALRPMNDTTVEIKRMFVFPTHRGMGLGSYLLGELERWGAALDYTHAVLETGNYMLDAVALYRKNGYVEIDRYPPYEAAERSVCFGKPLGKLEFD